MFMRSSLSSDAVSKYVAYCLVQHYGRVQKCRKRGFELVGRNNGDATAPSNGIASIDMPLPALSEIVASGASNQITLAVATVGKIYAQRLVKAARDVATRDKYQSDGVLLPEHVLRAYETRLRQGKDPGFYMHFPSEKHVSFEYNALNRSVIESRNIQEYFDSVNPPNITHFDTSKSDEEVQDRVCE
jgi:hypothetical protein